MCGEFGETVVEAATFFFFFWHGPGVISILKPKAFVFLRLPRQRKPTSYISLTPCEVKCSDSNSESNVAGCSTAG